MRYIIMILLLIAVLPVSAQTATPTPLQQSNCGHGLPCGAIPWQLPVMPLLESPTPLFLSSSADPEPTATPTPPDFLEEVDGLDELTDQLLALTGTPIDFEVTEEAEYEALFENSTLFFSHVKGLTLADLGVITPLLVGFFGLSTLTIVVKLSLFLLPIVGMIIGLIRKIIELIPFI